MRAWRQRLLATLAVVALVGGAQAGERVDRLDDGTVLLKLGPDYGDAVVETNASELGGLLGSDSRPLAGVTVRVLTQDEGPRGAISGPLAAWAPVFEELSGARVKLELAPVTDRYEVA